MIARRNIALERWDNLSYLVKKLVEICTNRVFLLATAFSIMFAILISRLFFLQIVKGEEYVQNDSYSQIEIETEGIRGNIYDVNGRPLTVNEVVYSIKILPEDITGLDPDILNNQILDLIKIAESNGEIVNSELPLELQGDEIIFSVNSDSKVRYFLREIYGVKELTKEQLNLTGNDVFNILLDKFSISKDFNEKYTHEDALKIMNVRYQLYLGRFKSYQSITLVESIKNETLVFLKEHQRDFTGIYVTNDVVRRYPYGESVAHITGYTGIIDSYMLEELQEKGYDQNSIVGRSGIEKEMELYLQGTSGKKVYNINSQGKIVSEEVVELPQQGNDVYLSIDARLQQQLYKRLEEQLADVLLDKIVVTPTKPGQIGINEVLLALFKNRLIDIDELSTSNDYYSARVYNAFKSVKKDLENRYRQLVFSGSLIKDYGELYQNFYIEMAQTMKISKHFIYDYDNAQYEYQKHESYETYKKYEISTPDFIKLSLENDFIQRSVYTDLSSDLDQATQQILTYEVDKLVKSDNFTLQVFQYMIENNLISGSNIIMILYEQGIITGSQQEMDNAATGRFSPLAVIENKLNYNNFADGIPQIKPYQLGLDPSTASVVITDVNTGSVKAMVSYPGYDNNRMNERGYYNSLINNSTKPLLNRPIQEKTEPGSTFKMLSAMAALEEGVVTVNEKINSIGTFTKGNPDKPPKCWAVGYGYVHGPTDVKRALEVSCNYYFSEMGFRLGKLENNAFSHKTAISILDKYIHYFGLDTTSGVELGEQNPQNTSFDALRAAFGNNRNLYNPAQLARYVSSIANGGTTYNLFMIDKVISQQKEVVDEGKTTVYYENNFQPEYIEAIQQGMYDVTTGKNGTAKSIFAGFEVPVAGKTGTAQNSHGEGNDHAVFTGYAPYDNPQIGISLVLPYAGGSANAAKVSREIIGIYFNIQEEKTEEDKTEDNQFIY